MTQLTVRRADERGTTRLDWLHSRHSFSFGQYHDPRRTGFRTLRVINDDVVAPGAGFGEHSHRDMEILTWVLSGALRHRDSMGHEGLLRPGELQVMTAGRGIRHSEMNASEVEPVRFLQMWIEPARPGLEPRYGQLPFDPAGRRNAWQLVATGRGGNAPDGTLSIHQDASLSVADLQAQGRLTATVAEDRFGYLHVATGTVTAGDAELSDGDALELAGPASIDIQAAEPGQLLLFDLA